MSLPAPLAEFRRNYPATVADIAGRPWAHLAVGTGPAVLLLHGMAGGYDIWWKQIPDLAESHRVVSVTYPPIKNLADLAAGLIEILDRAGITDVTVVGSSLGGYVAQYLVATHGDRVVRVVLGNTFPPNDLQRKQTARLRPILPILPGRVIMGNLRKTSRERLYPASGGSDDLAAYLEAQAAGDMTGRQFKARLRCVLDHFTAPRITVPALIIEATNDPLVVPELRSALVATYPDAAVATMGDVGHFPYLSHPDEYNSILFPFLDTEPT